MCIFYSLCLSAFLFLFLKSTLQKREIGSRKSALAEREKEGGGNRECVATEGEWEQTECIIRVRVRAERVYQQSKSGSRESVTGQQQSRSGSRESVAKEGEWEQIECISRVREGAERV